MEQGGAAIVTGGTTDLEAELVEARKASPSERIQFRDGIAQHGSQAIPAMTDWLGDVQLGAFAVRVLTQIAQEPRNRRAVLDALASVETEMLSEPVARDVSDAIRRIAGPPPKGATGSGGKKRTQGEQWPGSRPVTGLDLRFHGAMLDVFRLAGEATRQRRPDGTIARGYWANYFLRGVRAHGGPDYARQLLRATGTSTGFQRLKDEGRLDLTVEALVLQPEYSGLFADVELATAARRIGGFRPPRG